jgi:hypothetical protein
MGRVLLPTGLLTIETMAWTMPVKVLLGPVTIAALPFDHPLVPIFSLSNEHRFGADPLRRIAGVFFIM